MFLPSLTSPPKAETIGAIGMSLASTDPLNPLFLRTLDQSCVDTRNPRTSRAYEQHVLDDLVYFPHQLEYSDRKSRLIPINVIIFHSKRCMGNTPDN